MRKLLYAGFCAALMLGFGCAVTNYPLIVNENDGSVINTNGKARIETAQVAFTVNPSDGETHNTQWYVDQKANGDRVLTTYDFATALDAPTPFVSDIYCTPEWNGCALVTAQDPQVGDVDVYDYSYNAACDQAGSRGASVFYLHDNDQPFYGYGRQGYYNYGECGRGSAAQLERRIAMLSQGLRGEFKGQSGLWYTLNRNNTTVTLDNQAGYTTALNLNTTARVWFSPSAGRAFVDAASPMRAGDLRRYADFLANHATAGTLVTINYNGLSWKANIAGNRGTNAPISSAKAVLARANSIF